MPTPLRGRDREAADLHEHLGRLRAGRATTWLIEGGAGLGKTRLLEEVISGSQAAGFTVGHAGAEPDGAAMPLGVLMEALFDGPRAPLSLDESRPQPEQRYWLLRDMPALLERAAARQPVVVCLDDLQWADSETLAALRILPARLASLPVGWILSFRPGRRTDLDRTVAALRGDGARLTSLEPLGPAAVADVATDVLGAVPDGDILALAQGTGGIPFWLIELLSGLRDEHLVAIGAGQATLEDRRLPRRLGETMGRRLSRMTPAARTVAAVGASMGRRFTIAQLAAVLDAPASTLLQPVEELLAAELFTGRDDQLGFRHDLNREAVRASQPPSAARALDRQVATALLAAGALPAEVAAALAASATPGDEVAITTLMKASDALASTDPAQAAELARHAVDLTVEQHPLRGPLVAKVVVLLHAAGRGGEAMAFADGALRQVLLAEQEAEVRLSIANLFSVSPDTRAESCRRALALPGLPYDLQARLLARLLANLVEAGRTDQAEQLLDQARAAVAGTRDSAARFTLELAEAKLSYARDPFETALARIDSSLRNGIGVGEHSRESCARQLRCEILTILGRHEEAFAAAADDIRSARRARQAWTIHLFETFRGRQLVQLGQLADAAAALEGRFAPETAHLVVGVRDAASVVALGRVAIHTGNQGQAAITAAIATVMVQSGVPAVQRHAAWLLSLQAQARGDTAGARRWLGALGENERLSIFPLVPLDPADDPQLVRIAMGAGDRELAEVTTEAAERRHQANPHATATLASAAHARGLLTGDAVLLGQAVAALEDGPRQLAMASALEDLAVAEARAGRSHLAVAALDRALGIYAACGASWDLARVRRRLRRLGVRRRLVSERRPANGWAAMTDAEVAVVRLVASGLTNKEVAERLYISPHTASGHLRHAFEKLGINSRMALARIAAEHSD
ncbi:MAG TPA: AAA family ATPase [Trebonia sp.]|nr:AAA family ATPase [Trebonia sp.]